MRYAPHIGCLWAASLFWLLVGVGCSDRKAAFPESFGTKRSAATAAAQRPGPGSLAGLALAHSRWAAALGPHKLKIRHKVTASVKGFAPRKVDQTLSLRVDEKGRFHLTKNTHPQYGTEAVLADGWLYSRLRYSKFVRHKPRPGETDRLLDRLTGHLGQTLAVIGRFCHLTDKGAVTVGDRAARRVTIGLRQTPGKATRPRGRAERWRGAIKVTALSGSVDIDDKSGAPLSATLRASWTFVPPKPKPLPRSGIPAQLDPERSGTMSVELTQTVRPGDVKPVTAPPADDTLPSVRRRRLELERQMLTGELPIPSDWSKVP